MKGSSLKQQQQQQRSTGRVSLQQNAAAAVSLSAGLLVAAATRQGATWLRGVAAGARLLRQGRLRHHDDSSTASR